MANDYESGVEILGVAHSLEEAKEIFNKSLTVVKACAEEYGFTIYDDCETVFDSGEDGFYARNHTNLYIKMV